MIQVYQLVFFPRELGSLFLARTMDRWEELREREWTEELDTFILKLTFVWSCCAIILIFTEKYGVLYYLLS